MIYAVGIDTDKTMQHFLAAAEDLDPTFVDMNRMFDTDWRFQLGTEGVAAAAANLCDHIDPSASFYVRLVDLSPVLRPRWDSRWRAMIAGLAAFLESAPGRVANRPGSQTHNGTKPLHEVWLHRRGFDVPPAITTSDKSAILDFLAREGSAICKTLCGVRGTARLVGSDAFEGFDRRQGPVHLQSYVAGFDVRVHLVGDKPHGERIVAEGVDYRDRDTPSCHEPIEVPSELTRRMRSAADEMGLAFSGWDFKVDADGRWWCLEVNPMPGYDSYDRRADQAITRSLTEWLSDG